MILYPDKTIENMEKNYVTGSIYLAAVKRVVRRTSLLSVASFGGWEFTPAYRGRLRAGWCDDALGPGRKC